MIYNDHLIMSKKQLIVNADGFGFTFGNNRAILEVLEQGFVKSVSVNVTWPAVEQVKILVRDFPHVTIGIHLNLSVGPSILPSKEIPSLSASNGEFHGNNFMRLACRGKLNPDEMRRELTAQVDRLRNLGVRITHWDSHQARHLYPGFFAAALEVAKENKIFATRSHRYYIVAPSKERLSYLFKYYAKRPMGIITHSLASYRMRCVKKAGFLVPDRRLVLLALGPNAPHMAEAWETLLKEMPAGLNFIECHPGYVDDDLRRYSTFLEPREKEREMFCGQNWLKKAKDYGVDIVSYKTLLG